MATFITRREETARNREHHPVRRRLLPETLHQHALLFTAIFAVTAMATFQPAMAGLIFLDLPDGRIEVSYAGDVAGQAVAFAGVVGNFNQNIGSSVTAAIEDENSQGFAFASNEIIFRALASVSSSTFGSASGMASATGGEVIVLDLRTSDVIPTSLQGWFNLDGSMSYSVGLGPEGEQIGFANAQFRWFVSDLDGSVRIALANGISNSPIATQPPSGSYVVPDGLHSATLGVSFRWLLSDGTTTLEDQARQPDFAVLGYSESLLVEAGAQGSASAEADFANSATFTALLFDDGSTPESHGIDLYFLSGRTSPNLESAAVPEPASLLAWAGLGVLGLMGGVGRRRMMPRVAM